MNNYEATINAVDALLPQTQCRLCTYSDCRAYATAIVTQGETINRCLPGGVKVLRQLGNLLQQNPEPFVAEMTKKTQVPRLAVIREAECIGCAKCLQACPVDAIIGAGKFMHTVISDACTGCELCVAPCPVDCIDLVPSTSAEFSPLFQQQSRERYQQRQARLARKTEQAQHQDIQLSQETDNQTLADRQTAIEAAVARARAKKNNSIL